MKHAILTTAILFLTNLSWAQSKPLPMTLVNAQNFGQNSTYLIVVDEKNIVCDAPKLVQASFSKFMRQVPKKLQTEYMELQLFAYWQSHDQPQDFSSVGLDFFRFLETNPLSKKARYEEVCYKLNPHTSPIIVKFTEQLENKPKNNAQVLVKN